MRGKLHLPLAAMAGGAVFASTGEIGKFVCIGVLTMIFFRVRRMWRIFLLSSFLCFGYWYFAPAEKTSLNLTPHLITGTISSGITETDQSIQVILTKDNKNPVEKVQLTYFKEQMDALYLEKLQNQWKYGAACTIYSSEEEVKEARNPGEFDFRHYLARQQIYSQVVITKDIRMSCKGSSWLQYLFEQRNRMEFTVKNAVSTTAYPWIKALIFGETDELDKDTLEWFREWGLSHLLAISGLHIGLFLTLFMLLFYRTGIASMEQVRFSLICILPAYSFIAGGAPSVLRASLMGVIALLLAQAGLRMAVTDILSITAIVLLIASPDMLQQPGFQFSFLVTFALIFSSKIFLQEQNFLTLSAKICLISQLCVLPLQVHYFYECNPLSLLANLLLVPYFSFLLLPISLLLVLQAFIFPKIAFVFSTLTFSCHTQLLNYIEILSSKVLFQWTIGAIPTPWILVFSGSFVMMMIFWSRRKLKLTFYLAVVCCSVLIVYSSLPYFSSQGTVTMLDIGQGDTFVIELPFRRGVMMIDAAGPPIFTENKTRTEEMVIAPFLKSRGISHLDAMLVSHHDWDHNGSVSPILHDFTVDRLIVSPYYKFEKKQGPKVEVNRVKAGDKFSIQGQQFSVLEPDREASSTNDNSVVLLTKLGGKLWMFTGDSSVEKEEEMVRNGSNLDVDVLKVGHHGSHTSTSEEWLEALTPEIALISAGEHNRYGHPHQDVINKLKDMGIIIWRTDQHGAVQYKFSGGEGTFYPFLSYNASRE
ncbi:DNA internalization-related competence protein ComEC/Rec2 [Halobacillus salinarum]|uniref:DNA internalization-related competence protein ComEC/Rec2 n=1 Tax=Halobacillus salinarum TaxID=2932257 RepID=A0ABY4EQS7_9BACI|nr:DNA internalization-related competence protein ComEC/Rec2 [Halobacillus salinarum]UOQ46325.1 DNA internalization-related competence protein ComEC/Rec2 [Halobacillus salinarum]